MDGLRVVEITNGLGARIEVEVEFEGDREGGSITIEGINITSNDLLRNGYLVTIRLMMIPITTLRRMRMVTAI